MMQEQAAKQKDTEGDSVGENEDQNILVSYQNNKRRRSSILKQLMLSDPSIREEIAELKEEHLSSLVSTENLYGQELVQLNEKRRTELAKVKAAHTVEQAMMKAQVQHAQTLIRRLSLGQATISEAQEYLQSATTDIEKSSED